MDSNTNRDSEIIRFHRPSGLPGVEVMDVANSRHTEKAYIETYAFCGVLHKLHTNCGYWQYRGRHYVSPGGASIFVEPGDTRVIRKVEGRGTYSVVFVQPELVRQIGEELTGRMMPAIREHNVVDAPLLEDFKYLRRALLGSGPPLLRQSILETYLGGILRRFGEATPRLPRHPSRLALQRARDYIVARFADPVTLDEVAGVAGLTRWHFLRAFKREFGMPPHKFQIAVRMAKAKRLLASGARAADLDVGVSGQSHLIAHFKDIYGLTPGQYQAMLGLPRPS